MSHRSEWLAVVKGDKPSRMPFFPDITSWYSAHRFKAGEPLKGGCGWFLSDADPYHKNSGTMPDVYHGFTMLDFYRHFDWGLHIHHYDWSRREYGGNVRRIQEVHGDSKIIRLITPKGELQRHEGLANDGSWCPVEHFCKEMRDLDIMRLVVDATQYVPQYGKVAAAMAEYGEMGVGDMVLDRSPFGKLVHEYMGFEQTIYALDEDRAYVEDFLRFQEQKDLELVQLAAQGPEILVILTDHADERLISPQQYQEFCIPYYQKITALLHKHGKFVSTHLDGNFKSFFPLLGRTGFDVLDGCTPAPMFNYEVEELGKALPAGMSAYCGVPSTLFCQKLPTKTILDFGDRITHSLAGRAILNIGDLLPTDGDIEQVIALGRHVRG